MSVSRPYKQQHRAYQALSTGGTQVTGGTPSGDFIQRIVLGAWQDCHQDWKCILPYLYEEFIRPWIPTKDYNPYVPAPGTTPTYQSDIDKCKAKCAPNAYGNLSQGYVGNCQCTPCPHGCPAKYHRIVGTCGCTPDVPSRTQTAPAPRTLNVPSGRCGYSGCTGLAAGQTCNYCRCSGICRSKGGIRTLLSNGSCWCNGTSVTGSSGPQPVPVGTGQTSTGACRCTFPGCSGISSAPSTCGTCCTARRTYYLNRCKSQCKGYSGGLNMTASGGCSCRGSRTSTTSYGCKCSFSGCGGLLAGGTCNTCCSSRRSYYINRCQSQCRGYSGGYNMTSTGGCSCRGSKSSGGTSGGTSGGCSLSLKQRCGNFCLSYPGTHWSLNSQCSCHCVR